MATRLHQIGSVTFKRPFKELNSAQNTHQSSWPIWTKIDNFMNNKVD